VVFDEAQHIPGIGRILKLLHDTYPDIQIIATGSSSFSLSSDLSEPLTGRALEFILHPFSYTEFAQVYTPSERPQLLSLNLRYGFYPDLAGKNEEDARFLLDNLSSKFLFRDILAFETLRKPSILVKLLQMLAFQLGSEVSMNELAVNLGVTRKTIEHYLDLLEKSFVIFRLSAFSRNLRQEINKKVKIYFYDLGIRNSIIAAFNPLELRNDTGALWENFCLVERIKYLQSVKRYPRQYFWRTHQQQEIDYIEEEDGLISAFEFKFSGSAARMPQSFQRAYPESSFRVINRINFLSFITQVE
jgi:uncharacterized protein